ncbi:MAG: hypothetical protein NTAFB05_00450 [Nitrobacter sp.]|uniref:winged helix-turn-helix domain-containing protein n=1 Tax=Nitrobacter sp. TaxID=29420 RepID=UPI00387DF29F
MSIWLFFRIEHTRVDPVGRQKFGSAAGMGPGTVCILEAIDRYGSISAAAPAVDRKFQQLWKIVQNLNTMYKEPVIKIRRSGPSSGAFLTPLGKEVVTRFREMERVANQTFEKDFREFEALVGVDSSAPPRIPRFAQVIDPGTITKPAKKRTKTRQLIKKAKKSTTKAPSGRRHANKK